MKNSRHSIALMCAMALVASLCNSRIANAQTATIVVNDPRPVAEAAQRLQQIYGVPITYEDPLYVHESEMDAKKAAVRSAAGPTAITFDIATAGLNTTQRETMAIAALDQMLQTYNAGRGAEMFKVSHAATVIHVIPIHYITQTGKTAEFQPPLDTRVTISSQTRTGAALISEIFRSIEGQTGQKLDETISSGIFEQHTTKLGAKDEPARDVLDRLFLEMTTEKGKSPSTALSWRLLCDPSPSLGCFFNVKVVDLKPASLSATVKPEE